MGVALSATAVGVLLVGLTLAVAGFVKARHERDRAVAAENEVRQERDRAVTAERQTEQERNHAEQLAAEAKLAEGQSKLESGKDLGLMDFVNAYNLAKHEPALQSFIGRRWATWQSAWDRRKIAIRSVCGTPSPDLLQYASVRDWGPRNREKEVRLQDTLSGALVVAPMAHESIAVACAFSPNGRLLATLTREGVIHLWDRKTGEPERPPCATGVAGPEFLAFSPCGRYLVAYPRKFAKKDTRVVLLRLDEASGQGHILNHRYPVCDVRFSADGAMLAVMCEPELQLWRTSDYQPEGPALAVDDGSIFDLSPSGTSLAFNLPDAKAIGLLNPTTRQISQVLPQGEFNARYLAFSHHERWIAWVDARGSLEVRETQTGARPYAAPQLGGPLDRVIFSPDDSLMVATEQGGTVHVLRTDNGSQVFTLQVPRTAKAHFLTNGVLAVRGGYSEYVQFIDLEAAPLPETPLLQDAMASCLAFDDAGGLLAIGGEGELRLWSMQSPPTLQRIVRLPGRVLALTFLTAESQFLVFSEDGSLTKVEPRTGGTTPVGNMGRGREMKAVLSPDGRKLALFRIFEMLVVNTSTGALQAPPADAGMLSVAFRPDSDCMAVGNARLAVGLFNTSGETNTILRELGSFESGVYAVAFHPDGNLLAAAVGQTGLCLHDSRNNRTLSSVKALSLTRVNLLAVSPDGLLLAAAGTAPDRRHAVELWHVDPRRGLFYSGVSLPHNYTISSLAFSPDNRKLAVGNVGTTRLWQLPPPPRDLEEMESRTWATVGWRKDNGGELVFEPPVRETDAQHLARLTRPAKPTEPPLDAVFKLPLTSLERLAEQHPETTIYRILQSRVQVSLLTQAAGQGLWTQVVAHADEAIRLSRTRQSLAVGARLPAWGLAILTATGRPAGR